MILLYVVILARINEMRIKREFSFMLHAHEIAHEIANVDQKTVDRAPFNLHANLLAPSAMSAAGLS